MTKPTVTIDADLFDRIERFLESQLPNGEAAAILQELEDAEIERRQEEKRLTMIELRITNYQAIQLDALLNTLSVLASPNLPDHIRQELARGFNDNQELKAVAEKLRAELDNLVQAQRVVAGYQPGGAHFDEEYR